MSLMRLVLDEVMEAGGGCFVDEHGVLVKKDDEDPTAPKKEAQQNSNSLGGPQALPSRPPTPGCDSEKIFRRYFTTEAHKEEIDDMLWFVAAPPSDLLNCSTSSAATATSSASSRNPEKAFTRRRTDPDSFPIRGSPDIDWRATLYLNIITQWEYVLTVAVCRSHLRGRRDMVALKWVQRRVYAQPYSADSLDKHGMFQVTWPNIFFTVDDFAEAFGDIRMEDGQGWCVELVANCGENVKIPVFRGAVPYEKMIKGFHANSSPVARAFFNRKEEHEIIKMKGPGGRGAARAAVSLAPLEDGTQALKCCLVLVSALWVDIAYCLENPVSKSWLHLPTPEELEEELQLNDELKAAKRKAQELNKLAKEDEKSGVVQRLQKATEKASKWFDGLKDSLAKKGEGGEQRQQQEEQQQQISAALPFKGTRVQACGLKADRWKHLNDLYGVVVDHHPTVLDAVIVQFEGKEEKATLRIANLNIIDEPNGDLNDPEETATDRRPPPSLIAPLAPAPDASSPDTSATPTSPGWNPAASPLS